LETKSLPDWGGQLRVFLSYNTPDLQTAKALKQAIEASDAGIQVFFAPYNLKVGAFWVPALGEAIAEADAFLILLGKQIGDWQKLEYYEAVDRKAKERQANRGFPLVPVKISERTPNLPFLGQFNWIETLEPTALDPLSKIMSGLKGAEIDAVAAPWRTVNPYRGLEALHEEDAEFFFGRGRETEAVLDAIAVKKGRLIALIGNSGVGKSSLAQAGVIGSLKRQRWPTDSARLSWPEQLGDSRAWSYLTMKPGDRPVRALASAFTGLWFEDPTDPTRLQRTDEWEARLNARGQLSELLDSTATRFRQMGVEPPRRIFLYIDQGEELYSRAPKEDARRFSKILSDGLKDERLVTMTSQRSDYYGQLQADGFLFPVAEKIDVPPLGTQELEVVLREPARLLGVHFENEQLIDYVVNSAQDQPGALPLLADIMAELWERMQQRGDRLLRITDQQDIIQLGNALARRADKFLNQNAPQGPAVRDLCTLKLTSVRAQGEPVRRRAHKSECTDSEWRLVETLAAPDWRILVTSDSDGIPTAEVAHEVVLTKWETLKRWLTEEREFLIWKGNVEQSLIEWRAAPFYLRRDALLSGNALFQAKRWIKLKKTYFSGDMRRFVNKSLRRKWPVRILSILGAITLILLIWGTPALQRYNGEMVWDDPQARAWATGLILFVIMIVLFLLSVIRSVVYGALRVWKERISH
jgi:energy-coupling factor transporter ATP-binding protein EcfA2